MQEAALLEALKTALRPSPERDEILRVQLKELVNAAQLSVKRYKEREGDAHPKTLQAKDMADRLSALRGDFEVGRTDAAQVAKQLLTVLDEQMRANQYGAFFTSFDGERARGFAKGALTKFEFPVARLLELGARGQLYAGIENDIEIAFLPGMDLREFVEGFQEYEKIDSKL